MVRLRRFKQDDFEAYASTLRETSDWGEDAPAELRAKLEVLGQSDDIWVADVSSKAVGFMMLTTNEDGSLEVEWLDVHPDFQGRGVGRALLDRAVRTARRRGIATLSIHTQPDNAKMLSLAGRTGFVLSEIIKDHYAPGRDGIRLLRRL